MTLKNLKILDEHTEMNSESSVVLFSNETFQNELIIEVCFEENKIYLENGTVLDLLTPIENFKFFKVQEEDDFYIEDLPQNQKKVITAYKKLTCKKNKRSFLAFIDLDTNFLITNFEVIENLKSEKSMIENDIFTPLGLVWLTPFYPINIF